MGRIRDWIEERTGLSTFEKFGQDYLAKPVPPHVNYSFTLGTAALVLFMTQIGSGILLAFNYSSSLKEAYDSVARITFDVPSGWLIRSFHAWGAHMMVFVLFLHMVRVFWYGGYKRPREVTWVFGSALLILTMLFGFTGYLLPMDQVSYWGTVVATDPMFGLPLAGDTVGRIVRGGTEVNDSTLSRFFIIHVFILPATVGALVAAHLYLVGRNGISTKESVTDEMGRGYKSLMKESGVPFKKHMYREVTTVVVVLSLVIILAVLFPFELGPRATPEETPKGVKPEWYFLPVYQFLKYVPKLVGLLLVNLVVVLFVLLPFLDRNPERRPGKRKAMMLIAAAGLLATLALGTVGHFAETNVGNWHIDMLGRPHRIEPGK